MRSAVVSMVLALACTRAFAQDAGMPAPAAPNVCPRIEAMGDAPLLVERDTVLLTARDLMVEVNRQPQALRETQCTPASLRALAMSLVHHRVLASEAERRHVDERPEVRREIELILSRAISREILDASPQASVTEAEARAFYDAHIAQYTRPARVKVLVVWIENERLVARIADQLRGAKERKFRQVSMRYTTDRRIRSRRGELGWISSDNASMDPALVAAALSLQSVGEVTREPVRTSEGDFVWVRALELEPPTPIAFEDVRANIVSRMVADRNAMRIDVFLQDAMGSRGLQVRMPAELSP